MLNIPFWQRSLIILICVIGGLFAVPNLFYNKVEGANDARMAIAAGSNDSALDELASGWPDFLPSSLVNLGLDLRGGAHLLAEVQTQDVYAARMKALWPDLRNLLREKRAEIGTIRLQDGPADQLRVRISRPEAIDIALAEARSLARPITTVTGIGGLDLDFTTDGADLIVQLSQAEKEATDARTVSQALEIIRKRIDEVGTREPTIQRQGAKRILIQVPGIGSAAELKAIIGTTAQLTFQPVIRRASNDTARPAPGTEILPSAEEDGLYYVLESAPVVTGENLVDAQPSLDQNNRNAVSFRFNPSGARRFGDYTAQNIGSPFAIVLDGKVISAPVIQSHIPGGSGIITGRFSFEETNNLAVLLRAGALPAELTFLEERTIGPELGADSIAAGKIASIVAFALVLIFMALSYGLFGVFANIALITNIVLVFALLSILGATLTLPGIAGIVLTIGMAVDANVLIFERIREEISAGKSPARAIDLGYEKAQSAIIDANLTTMITAVILFAMGSGPVRGFAITLGLGIITSVFTAIFVTRLIILIWYERRRPKILEV